MQINNEEDSPSEGNSKKCIFLFTFFIKRDGLEYNS
jgi:hypothetical protein